MRHPALRIISRLLDLAFLALVALVVTAGGLSFLAPFTGRQAVVVGGGSMEPAIPFGALAVVTRDGVESLRSGDAATVRVGESGTLVTHRVVRIAERAGVRYLELKGDANAASDAALVPATAVVGRVELTIPLAGYLLAILFTPLGFSALLCLAAALLCGCWLCDEIDAAAEAAAGRSLPAPAIAGPAVPPTADVRRRRATTALPAGARARPG